MFKPNIHLRLSTPTGPLAVNQSLIELFLKTVYWITRDDESYGGITIRVINNVRESLRSIGCQLSSYLSWFALFRLAQDVKHEYIR
ncbi:MULTISPECIES: hypothetical protein [Aquimarina]|uniref:hypothetical protein n=1 Tax=Aquimarina TaxID=290174 RepID=UPI000B33F041|nr:MULTISPECIES: hypothetical protein [Aquimarina]